MRRIDITATVASALFVACLPLVSGCGDANERSNATEQAGGNATPKTQAVVGPLLVYATEVRFAETAERRWPTLAVLTYDVRARRELSSFEIGDVGSYPSQVELAGRSVVVNFEHRIDAFELDGSGQRTLLSAPDAGGSGISGFSVSPSGSLLAATVHPGQAGAAGYLLGDPSIVVLDVRTVDTVAELSPPGWLVAPVGWLPDDAGLVLYPPQGSSSFALQRLDGSSRIYETGGSTIVSPGARYAATLTGVGDEADLVCISTKPELVVRDLASDAVVATIRPEGANVELGVTAWSPDGTELLYQTMRHSDEPVDPGCVSLDGASQRWFLLRLPAGTSEPVADEFTARRWQGDRYVEYRCDGEPRPYAFCADAQGVTTPVDVYVGGALVGSGVEARVLGFVE